MEPLKDLFQLPSLATPVQTYNIHVVPLEKFQLPSLATPVQTCFYVEKGFPLFQLPSLATPVQTGIDGKERVVRSFNCLHWRPRFKQGHFVRGGSEKFQLPSLATPVQTFWLIDIGVIDNVSIAFIGDPGSN